MDTQMLVAKSSAEMTPEQREEEHVRALHRRLEELKLEIKLRTPEPEKKSKPKE